MHELLFYKDYVYYKKIMKTNSLETTAFFGYWF